MYYRIVLIANPSLGSASFSWRVKCALENLGHTVFWFTPKRHSFAFKGDERKPHLGSFARFITRQKPDCLIMADGTSLTAELADGLRELHPGMLLGYLLESGGGIEKATDLDFILAAKPELAEAALTAGITREARACAPLVDQTYLRTPLANTVACPPCVTCLQDATPARVEAMSRVAKAAGDSDSKICLIGPSWPKEWRADVSGGNGFAYVSRSSAAVLHFDDGGDAPDANLLALAEADGTPIVSVGEGGPLAEADVERAAQAVRAIAEEGLPLESRRFATHARDAGSTHTLEDELREALELLAQPAPGRPALAGCAKPRSMVTVMGYFGMGNFGDEYILATLDERIRTEVPGSSVIAVSENPEHTFVNRGVYATTMQDICAVDRALAYSSAALVVAGLLFDQGIRWTAGKAEAFTSARCSDIPGIAAFSSMAAANGAPMVFHGIGAGPLDVLDARQLVGLMGRQGAVFTPRDKQTGDIIRSCGVPEGQVIDCADTVFLREARAMKAAGTNAVTVSLREYENTPPDFPERMAQALDSIAERRPESEFVFCILDPGDLALSEKVIALMHAESRCRIFDYAENLDALVDLLASAKAGFSMRYHSALVMASFGVPCAGMDYLPKVASLYADLGATDLLVHPTASAEECAAALLSAIEDGDRWRAAIGESVEPLQSKARRALDILLEQIESACTRKHFEIPQEYFLHVKPEPHRRIARHERKLGASASKKDSRKPSKPARPQAQASAQALPTGRLATLPLVSVIVPVYNSEKHLAECLDSLLGQTYRNIELICVDDGSRDESLAILHGYLARDGRVRVLTQENAGPGVARNRGLDEARGEIVYFFDSDDFCDAGLIEAAVAKMLETGADLVSFPFKEYDERVGASHVPAWADTPKSAFGTDVMHWRDNPDRVFQAFHNYPWNKMARTALIRENGIRYQEMHLTEDLMYSLPAVLSAHRLAFCDGHYVHHRVGTSDNAMSGKDAHPLDFVEALRALKSYLEERGIFEELNVSYANWAVSCCKYNLHTLNTLEAFRLVFDALAQGGAAELGLMDVDPAILFSDAYRSLLVALRSMTAEEYAWRLYAETLYAHELSAFRGKAEKAAARNELEKERGKLAKLRKSAEYRFGVKALRIPRAVKNAMRKGK